MVRICRFDFHHEYAAVLYKRRDPKGNVCRSKKCPYFGTKTKVKEVISKFPRRAPQAEHKMHPKYCPSNLAACEVKKMPLRKGKKLVLPEVFDA